MSGGTDERGPIDFGAARADRRTAFEDGVSTVRIEGAKLVRSRRKRTVSLVLEVRDIESDLRIALQPIFVSSPVNDWEGLAQQGQAKIADLLEAVTGEAPGKLKPQQVIEKLTGKTVTIEIRIVNDNNGNEVNQLVRVVEAALDSESKAPDGDSDDEARI